MTAMLSTFWSKSAVARLSAVAHTVLPSRARPAAQKAKVSDQDLSRGDEVSDGGHPSPVRGQLTIVGPNPQQASVLPHC